MNNISYDDIKLFVTVYESRSYTISAVKHNTSQPTVSRKIKQLEDHLQQKLFYYKNNIIWPTDFAQSLYESCHSTFKNLDDIISHLTAQTEAQEYSGTVRIQLPVIISKYIISPQIPYFLRKYPKLDLQIIYSNTEYDIIKNKIDIAIIGRRIVANDKLEVIPLATQLYLQLYGTQEYIDKYGMPNTPQEIQKHLFLGYINEEMNVQEYFKATHNSSGESITIPMSSQIVTNDGENGLAMMLSNEIIVGMIDIAAKNIEKVYNRKIVNILPDWHAQFMNYYLIKNTLKNQKNIELVSEFLINCFNKMDYVT